MSALHFLAAHFGLGLYLSISMSSTEPFGIEGPANREDESLQNQQR